MSSLEIIALDILTNYFGNEQIAKKTLRRLSKK